MSKSREQLNEYLKQINIEGKQVLDIGVQDKPTSRLCQGTPKKYVTLDIDGQWNPDLVEDLNDDFVHESYMGLKFEAGFDHPNPLKMINTYDVIFCIEVLEHCWNPVQAVENISKLLKPDGMAYISTPLINPHHDYVDYLRYTNEWYRDVLPKFGFDSVVIHERTATAGKGLLDAFFRTEGLRVSKIRPEYGKYTFPIGYFVEARKGKDA